MCSGIGPRQELVDAAIRMAVDDLADHIDQVGVRIDAVNLPAVVLGNPMQFAKLVLDGYTSGRRGYSSTALIILGCQRYFS